MRERDWLVLGGGASAERLAEIVGRRVVLRRRGAEWSGLCPFHHDKNPSFAIYKGRKDGHGRYYCQSCGANGSAIDWLRKMEGMSYGEAVKALNGEIKIGPDPMAPARAEAKRAASVIDQYRDRNPDCCLPDWMIETRRSVVGL